MKLLLIRSLSACLAVFALGLPSAFAQTTERVSVDSAGVQGNNVSRYTSISANGRFVAYSSSATNLVPGDTNGRSDVFVHDRLTGITERVSVDSAGLQATGHSNYPAISADGRFVAFNSEARNLVAGDTNASYDVFVHDRNSAVTTRVSIDSAGLQANGGSYNPTISADGRFVAFNADADNLVGGDTNAVSDIFYHDRQTGATIRVSVDSFGMQSNGMTSEPALSADGRHVAFFGFASNLVPGDTNGDSDVFVHDCQTGQTTMASISSTGVPGNDYSRSPSISADGRYVAFNSFASNLVSGDTAGHWDDFVHDRQAGTTTRVSVGSGNVQGNGDSYFCAISWSGRYVAFESGASNFVPGDVNGSNYDIFIHDRVTGMTEIASVDSAGIQGNAPSSDPTISADGRSAGFQSQATNLVPSDTNNREDVFVHDFVASGPSLVQAGNCPGPITLTVAGASPGGQVALVHGPAGVFVRPGQPCQGLTLGVSPPSLGAVRTADGAGVAILNFNAPPGACGRSVQAVDVTTCVATNTIVL